VAYLLEQCRSLARIPLGGEDWMPFAVLAPVLVIAAVVLARRSAVRAG
jgi:hypothetical protein